MSDTLTPDDLMTTRPAATPVFTVKPATPDPVSPELKKVLDQMIAPGESAGKYNVIYGGKTVDDLTKHPDVPVPITEGPNAGKMSTAAGKYQFIKSTWDEASKATGVSDFSPESQDINAAWLAKKTYHDQTGRDLEKDYASGDPKLREGIRRALSSQWESLGKPGPRVDKLWTLGNDRFRFDDNATEEHEDKDDTDIVYMRPKDYLTLSPSMDDDPGFSLSGWQGLRKSLAAGEPVKSIPTLQTVGGRVTGQDGRSRALLAQTAGIDAMPVAMRREGEPPGGELVGMNGASVPSNAYAPAKQFQTSKDSSGSIIGKFLGIGSAQAAEPGANPFAKFAPTAPVVSDNPFAKFGAAPAAPREATPPEAKDDLPWDVPFTGEQMRKEQTLREKSEATMNAVTPQPGLMHMLTDPIRTMVAGGQSATGERPIPKGMEALGEAGMGVDLPPSLAAKVVPGAGRSISERATNTVKGWLDGSAGQDAIKSKAVQEILNRITSDQRAGGATFQDMLDLLNAAPGKPMTIADVGDANLKSLLGRVARSPGDAKSIIANFLNNRDLNAGTRVSTDVMDAAGSGTRVYTDEALKAARSIQAKPLFEKAYQGGSLAPLKEQFERANADAGRAEAEAAKEVAHAQTRITEAARRESQAGDNVYGVNGAREDKRAAEAQLVFAQQKLEEARGNKESIAEVMRQAQDDLASNKPGAVWSPRIQEFLDNPRVRSGIQRGLIIERDEALAEGRRMNPTDYAVTGTEANGEAIIGKVPTMRLLAVAKEGLDRLLQSSDLRNQFGDLNKEGVAVDKLRAEFVRELDRLNPDYAKAREQWSGDTQSMLALKAGQGVFKMDPEAIESLLRGSSPDAIRSALTGKVPGEVVERAVERATKGMSPNDREFFRLGAANEMRKIIESTGERGDETRRLIGTTRGRRQLRAMFYSDAEFEKFFSSLNAEHQMFDTWSSVFGNSKTAERVAEDSTAKGVGQALKGAYHAVQGNVLGAVHGLGRALDSFRPDADPRVAAEQARILTSPGTDAIAKLQATQRARGQRAAAPFLPPPPPWALAPALVPGNPADAATQGMNTP